MYSLTCLFLFANNIFGFDANNKIDSKPLNILLLYADDWRHDTMGCAGNPIVKTPFLDEMAKNGIRFTNNYVTTSICGVSRANLLTGQWMSRHGNRAFDMFKTPWENTFPGLLRKNGYHVGHIGKWHNGAFPKDKYDYGKSYGGTHWVLDKNGTKTHVTQKNEIDALDFLANRPKEKPFCLTVAFFATHAEDRNPKQYLPMDKSMALYQGDHIPIPLTAGDEYFKRLPPFVGNEKNEGRVRWHWRFDTPEKYQEYMKNYYRLATEVDSVCGRCIAELEKQNLLKNTLVIFTTDNGYFHGEHGLADKWYPYQESIKVPLIVLDPRTPKNRAGITKKEFVLNVDLAPTILGAANINPPKSMQGEDFSDLYKSDRPKSWRSDFYYEHGTIKNKDFIPSSEALVSADWKFIAWPEFNYEELFDLNKDPRETENLAQAAEYKNTLKKLRDRFVSLKEQAK